MCPQQLTLRPLRQVRALVYLLENALAVFLIVFQRTLPPPSTTANDGADRSRGDDDMGSGDDAGREVSVFVDGAPSSSAQAQGRQVRRG
jgi:hypothetical protein